MPPEERNITRKKNPSISLYVFWACNIGLVFIVACWLYFLFTNPILLEELQFHFLGLGVVFFMLRLLTKPVHLPDEMSRDEAYELIQHETRYRQEILTDVIKDPFWYVFVAVFFIYPLMSLFL